MNLDFWNNPIIVSAFRVQFRRAGFFTSVSTYILLLAGGGAAVWYYFPANRPLFPRNYLICLLSMQCSVSALRAFAGTHNSLRVEVVKQTFDLQRIATLSPSQILIGKLLGESAPAYFLGMASVPLGAWCWMMGVPGVSLAVLVLAYDQVATTTVFFGCLGLMQRLTTDGDRNSLKGQQVNGVFALALFGVPVLAIMYFILAAKTWSGAIAGLLAPGPLFFGIYEGTPWRPALLLYGIPIPFLFVTPVSQLFLCLLMFRASARRVVYPEATAMSRPVAYSVCALFDLLAAAVLHEAPPLGFPLGARAAAFCFGHLVICLGLMVAVTPGRDVLMSWIWRFRGRRPWLSDVWLGERSENTLVTITFAVLGILGLLFFVLLPEALADGWAWSPADGRVILGSAATMTLVLVALGTLYQWCIAITPGSGAGIFWTIGVLLMVPAHIIGVVYKIDVVLALTPTAVFAAWIGNNAPPSLYPMLILYALILCAAFVAFRRRMARRVKVIDQKLELMKNPKPAGAAAGA
jgi:hypothetical protein